MTYKKSRSSTRIPHRDKCSAIQMRKNKQSQQVEWISLLFKSIGFHSTNDPSIWELTPNSTDFSDKRPKQMGAETKKLWIPFNKGHQRLGADTKNHGFHATNDPNKLEPTPRTPPGHSQGTPGCPSDRLRGLAGGI